MNDRYSLALNFFHNGVVIDAWKDVPRSAVPGLGKGGMPPYVGRPFMVDGVELEVVVGGSITAADAHALNYARVQPTAALKTKSGRQLKNPAMILAFFNRLEYYGWNVAGLDSFRRVHYPRGRKTAS